MKRDRALVFFKITKENTKSKNLFDKYFRPLTLPNLRWAILFLSFQFIASKSVSWDSQEQECCLWYKSKIVLFYSIKCREFQLLFNTSRLVLWICVYSRPRGFLNPPLRALIGWFRMPSHDHPNDFFDVGEGGVGRKCHPVPSFASNSEQMLSTWSTFICVFHGYKTPLETFNRYATSIYK
jgi:hypothetical protein